MELTTDDISIFPRKSLYQQSDIDKTLQAFIFSLLHEDSSF